MFIDGISEQRLQLIWPVLAGFARELILRLEAQFAIGCRVIQGLRSWQQQDGLYAQGRTKPGEIVTDARGGESWHNFGMAFDLCPSQFTPEQPFSPDWNSTHPIWHRMEAMGIALGLTSGANWKRLVDAPHFQLTGRFPENAPDDEVRQLFKAGGMKAVWAEIGVGLIPAK